MHIKASFKGIINMLQSHIWEKSMLETNIKKPLKRMGSAVVLCALMGGMTLASSANASSHREAINTMNDPCIDHTDLYAWVNPSDRDKLYLIASMVPLHQPGQGNQQTRFCDGVLYEFHLSKGITDLKDEIIYQIQFSSTPPTRVEPIDTNTPPGGGVELLIQVSGGTQTYTVTKVDKEAHTETVLGKNIPVTPTNIGPRSDRLAYGLGLFNSMDTASSTVGLYNDAFAATFITDLHNGGRSWVGQRDDGFYLDEAGIFDAINLRKQGVAEDIFAGTNLMAMALEIPIHDVFPEGVHHQGVAGDDTLLAVHHTASRKTTTIRSKEGNKSSGHWVQEGRQGLPLVNAALIGTQDQNKYLRTKPINDFNNFGSYFLFPVLVRDLELLGTYAKLGVDQDTIDELKGPRTDILDTVSLNNFPNPGSHHVPLKPGFVGDVLRLDVALDSQFPNGRRIDGGPTPNMEHIDVSDVLLTVIVSGGAIPISDGVQYNDKDYLTEFPFLPLPHDGFNDGNGKTTPLRDSDPQ
jgi:hypothetical protein